MASNLKELRKSAGLTLKEAGNLFGMSDVAVYKIETGQTRCEDTRNRLAILYTKIILEKMHLMSEQLKALENKEGEA